MKKFDKNYTNFIQMYLILNNKNSVTESYPDCCNIKSISCSNCLFRDAKKGLCKLFIQTPFYDRISLLKKEISKYTSAEQLTYLLQAEAKGDI